MQHVFGDHIGRTVEAYIDDIVMKTRKTDDLVSDLNISFGCLRANGVELIQKNVSLACREVRFWDTLSPSEASRPTLKRLRPLNGWVRFGTSRGFTGC
jgi:hypothetical protein